MIESLRRVRKLLEETERRKKENKLNVYRPHEKQKIFHKSKAPIRLFCGSNQSGKTTAGVCEAIAWAIGKRPWDGSITKFPPNAILAAGHDFTNHLAGVMLPKIYEYLPESSVAAVERMQNGIISRIIFKNGSFIKFGSFEQEADKFEGATWDFVWLDEPCPRDIWVAIKRGLMAKQGKAIFTLTPISEPWIFDEIYTQSETDPNIFAVNVSITDNPALTPQAIEEFKKNLTEEEIEARIYGRFKHLMGRVYKEFDVRVHVVEPERFKIDPNWPKGLTADPHDRRPFAMAWWAVTPRDEIIFFDEWPHEEFRKCQKSLTIKGYVDLIRQTEASIPGGADSIVWRLLDPNKGRSPTVATGNTLEEDFALEDIYFDTRINDDLVAGHHAVKKKLYYDKDKPIGLTNKPVLYITQNCRNMIQSLSLYTWAEWGGSKSGERASKEKPRDLWKDFADVCRYTSIFSPQYYDWRADINRNSVDRIMSSRVFLK